VHGVGEGVGVAWRDQQASLFVADGFGDAALVRADHRAGLRHGLGDDAGQALGVAIGGNDARHDQ
jgi:hypothetical protein